MIVEYVYDDPCIFMVFPGYSQLTPPGNGVFISKGVDIPVDQYPFLHQLGELQVILPFYVITHKISNNDLLIAPGKIGMCEKIQRLVFETITKIFEKFQIYILRINNQVV